MNEYPIIMRMESQSVISTRLTKPSGHIMTIRNVGYDKDGVRWQWYTDHITRYDIEGFGPTVISGGYGYRKLTDDASGEQDNTP